MTSIEIAPGKTRIGWIGTGVMARACAAICWPRAIAQRFITAPRAKAQPLLDQGAQWANSPREVAQASDVIFSIVGFPQDVRETILGANGALAGAQPGAVIVDMTTSEPTLAIEIAEAAAKHKVHAIDAPVSGGDVGAREARLSIMIGGERSVVDALDPLWQAMGKTIVYQGPAGAGQHTKMVNQILIASYMVGVCESLLYGYRAGLNLETVLESVGSGAAASWSLLNLGPRIMRGDYKPGFFVEHFIKDMGIALAEAKRMNLALPGLALAHQLYIALQAQGHGRDGTQALMLALAKISQVDWRPIAGQNK